MNDGMSARTTSPPRPRRTRVRDHLDPDLVTAIAAAAFALLVGPLLVRGPAFVDEVTVDNPSELDVQVRVGGADGDGWVSLTTVGAGTSATVRDVIDRGEVWTVDFAAQGRVGGEVQVTRDELEQRGWVIEVPDPVIARLREEGAEASP
jgi:hypothetical protein